MDKKYFLAIDIGASSGRHILASVNDGKLVLEEIYRFKNGAQNKGGTLVWDTDGLFSSITEGLKKCAELNKIPYSVGIDTWGVDYALLDENDKIIGDVISYRDSRTAEIIDKVHSVIPYDGYFAETGIQKQVFNTVYQLYDDKLTGRINGAKSFLMMPDYLHFLLTGVKSNEYTDASTTGLINAKSRTWDYDIIEKLGFPKHLFGKLYKAGTVIGELSESVRKKVGFNCIVVAPATHDTASAVMAVPKVGDKSVYISSGTWSLIGIEETEPNTSKSASDAGYTNEGGFDVKTIRFLKNIMGLWMIQCIKKEYKDKYSFTDFVDEAKKVKDFNSVVDVNDYSFFAPDSMIDAVKNYCKKTGQKVPETVGELVLCVYESLAIGYKKAIEDLEKISGKKFDTINIVGGGCQNVLLNELTAKRTGRKVITGPIEATATGNVLSQMISAGLIKDITEGRNLVKSSFEIKEIE